MSSNTVAIVNASCWDSVSIIESHNSKEQPELSTANQPCMNTWVLTLIPMREKIVEVSL